MKKGIVMEINDAFLTLLTPEGEFLHARRQDQPYAIGEEIHFFPIESVKTTNRFNKLKNVFKLKSAWALMALFIFLGSFFPMYQNNKAYAYMSIDVNPSIELGINKKMQVIQINGFNKEGKKIISRLNDWNKKDVSELTQTILAEIQKEGFLKNDEHVIISTARTNAPDVKIEKKLQENIKEIKASVSKQKIELIVLKATEKEREKAHKLGITSGKYQDNKIQASNNQKVKTKVNGKQIEKAVRKSPADATPPSQFKKQSANHAIQNKESVENNKQSEKKSSNPESLIPGQLKKNEEKRLIQKQGQPKKQNYQKQTKSEHTKSINNNEKHKGKDEKKKYKKRQLEI